MTNATGTFDDLSALGGEPQQATQQPNTQRRDTQQQQPAAPQHYSPPIVHIGEWVYWYSSARRSKQPCPALVTGVEGNVVWLTVFPRGKMPLPTRDAIRHIDDPHLKSHPHVAVKDGAWALRGE